MKLHLIVIGNEVFFDIDGTETLKQIRNRVLYEGSFRASAVETWEIRTERGSPIDINDLAALYVNQVLYLNPAPGYSG